MKIKHNSHCHLRSHSFIKGDEDDGDEADSHYIVVELDDENESSETEMDLSSFAPVESSECEEDEDELGAFTWGRAYSPERGNWKYTSPPKKQSSSRSVKGHHKMRSNPWAEQRRQQDTESKAANRKMESNKGTMKNCIKCNMAFGVATKVCKACGVMQPMKRRLQNKIKKYDEAWATTQMENGNLNKLFDETDLLLHKWQLLGMYPLFLLGMRRRSKTVAKCMCPITFNHPQYREAQDTIRQIFVELINAQLPVSQPTDTKALAQPSAPQPAVTQSPLTQSPVIQSLAQPFIGTSPRIGKPLVTQSLLPQSPITHSLTHPPMTHFLAAEQAPVTQSLVQPPITQALAQSTDAQPPDTRSLCSTLPTVSKDVDSTPAPTQKQISKKKTNFPLSKNEGSKHKQRKVQINVGIMLLHNGCLTPQRGKMLILYTHPEITAKDLLMMAEKKFKTVYNGMEEGPYILLYPDGSEVINVPGTQHPFTLKDYKSEIGKTYARINLFICRKKDYKDEQVLNSESHTVVLNTSNTEQSNVADTLPITLQSLSTPEKNITYVDSTPAPTQKQISKKKTNFLLSKNKGSKHKQRKVQINVGIMLLHNGCLTPQRGKMLILYTDPEITAKDLLLMAEKKFKTVFKGMEEGPYILLYPDGSEVINVPGTQRSFTLKDYKSKIGKTYARTNLFICRKKDFKEQVLNSESHTVVLNTSNTD